MLLSQQHGIEEGNRDHRLKSGVRCWPGRDKSAWKLTHSSRRLRFCGLDYAMRIQNLSMIRLPLPVQFHCLYLRSLNTRKVGGWKIIKFDQYCVISNHDSENNLEMVGYV
jgi:hypothetical protein